MLINLNVVTWKDLQGKDTFQLVKDRYIGYDPTSVKSKAKVCLCIGIILVICCYIANHPKINLLGICDLRRLDGAAASTHLASTWGWNHLQAHSLSCLVAGTGSKLQLSCRRSRNTCLAFTSGCVPRVSICGEEGSVSQGVLSAAHSSRAQVGRLTEARGGEIRPRPWWEEYETWGFKTTREECT